MTYHEVKGIYGPGTRDFVAEAIWRQGEARRRSWEEHVAEAKVRRVRVSEEANRIYLGPENPARPSSEAEGRVLMYDGEDVRRGALELARIRFMEEPGVVPHLFDFEDSVDVAIRGSLSALAEDDRIFWHVQAINAPPEQAVDPPPMSREMVARQRHLDDVAFVLLILLTAAVMAGLATAIRVLA